MAQHASYVAIIRRVSDGLERRSPETFPWDTEGENSWFWWSEGNYGCDCNRFLAFERSGGENPDMDDERIQCGHGAYQVVRFEFPDGTSIDGPDAEASKRHDA